MATKPSFWLMKSEPESFSIQDLARSPKKTTDWSGVRNYQARNFMRDMTKGDRVLFYHSSADPSAVVGTSVVVKEAYPDHTALDPKDHHYDPKATKEKPIWEMVDIKLDEIFPEPLPLGELRKVKALADMELLRKGSRLSVQPVRPREFEVVVQLAGQAAGTAKRAAKKKAAPAAKPRKKRSSAR
ncbi:MAG: EVE domain-containing protein [Planctomycetota bacterium]|nr:MAG: EVE domain-containing protein [Planctomycetota bacterium]